MAVRAAPAIRAPCPPPSSRGRRVYCSLPTPSQEEEKKRKKKVQFQSVPVFLPTSASLSLLYLFSTPLEARAVNLPKDQIVSSINEVNEVSFLLESSVEYWCFGCEVRDLCSDNCQNYLCFSQDSTLIWWAFTDTVAAFGFAGREHNRSGSASKLGFLRFCTADFSSCDRSSETHSSYRTASRRGSVKDCFPCDI